MLPSEVEGFCEDCSLCRPAVEVCAGEVRSSLGSCSCR